MPIGLTQNEQVIRKIISEELEEFTQNRLGEIVQNEIQRTFIRMVTGVLGIDLSDELSNKP